MKRLRGSSTKSDRKTHFRLWRVRHGICKSLYLLHQTRNEERFRAYCLSLSLFLTLFLFLCFSVSVCLRLSVCLSVCLCLSLPLSVSVSVSLDLSSPPTPTPQPSLLSRSLSLARSVFSIHTRSHSLYSPTLQSHWFSLFALATHASRGSERARKRETERELGR